MQNINIAYHPSRKKRYLFVPNSLGTQTEFSLYLLTMPERGGGGGLGRVIVIVGLHCHGIINKNHDHSIN